MEEICNPIPQGSIENKASRFLSTLHCIFYSDIEKLHLYLKWLDEQGFMNHNNVKGKVEPPPEDMNFKRELGGLSRYCLLYTSPSPRDRQKSRMPSSA